MAKEIIAAKTAGFCFGVARAVDIAYACDTEKNKFHTLGPIIHNHHVVDELENKGVTVINSIDEALPNAEVIIRTHGVPKAVYEEMDKRKIKYIDATCPYVKKIHSIVKKHHDGGAEIVIIGDETHPEVIGINGWCDNFAVVLKDEEAAKAYIPPEKQVCIVAQTTFNKKKYEKMIFFLKKTCKNVVIFDTICRATEERQKEAEKLASEVDAMIVLGGSDSSNTKKLYEISKAGCNEAYLLQTIHELPKAANFKNKRVGITAGASTPAVIIKEAIYTMENQEQSFASLFEESEAEKTTLNTGDVVTGTVSKVGPTEVIVNLGVKQDGFIPASEISDDPNLTPEQVVKVGDEIEVFVVRVNDVEGNIMLSKRKIDSMKSWNDFMKFYEEGKILEGKVTSVVNGGMIVTYKDIRVFVPASQANDRYLSDLSSLVGNVVPFKIIDVNEKRKRVVGSVKTVLLAQKAELEEKFWADAEVGKKYTGIVKSLTNFGAFVDIGGVDGLVHISELSWKRIKHPSEVTAVGEAIEVYIKDINAETKKISLGYKKAEDNPWEIAKAKLNVDDVVNVKIVRLLPFGAFAEIMPSVDGLIHISQIANKRIARPEDELSIGQTVDAKIVEIDWENKKIGLSIRALLPVEEKAAEAPAEQAAEDTAKEAEPTEYKEEVSNTIADAIEE